MPDTAPLFAPAAPTDRSESEPLAVPGSDHRNGSRAGPSHATEAALRAAPGSDHRNSGSSNGSRAGPTGPQAARAALRKARAAFPQEAERIGERTRPKRREAVVRAARERSEQERE